MLVMWLTEGTKVSAVEVKEFEVHVHGMQMEIRSMGFDSPWRKVAEWQLHDTEADARENVRQWLERKSRTEKAMGLPMVGKRSPIFHGLR
jgi:hypothetical protein